MIAVIRWIDFEDGGRKQIPVGCDYCAPACFAERSEFPDCSWSLCIQTISRQNFTRDDQQIDINFTTAFLLQAPQHFGKATGTWFSSGQSGMSHQLSRG